MELKTKLKTRNLTQSEFSKLRNCSLKSELKILRNLSKFAESKTEEFTQNLKTKINKKTKIRNQILSGQKSTKS